VSKVLGIVGAGKLGTTIGRLAADAGWQVLVSSGHPSPMQELIVSTMVPSARMAGWDALVHDADIVLLAIPFGKSDAIDYASLSGKVVIDPMNHWQAVDGQVDALDGRTGSTSEIVRLRNPAMRLVKTLNHLSYTDMVADARSFPAPDRRAVAVASDDPGARTLAASLVDDLGFDPVEVGFDAAATLDADGPVFGEWFDAEHLRQVLGSRSTETAGTTGEAQSDGVAKGTPVAPLG